MPKRITSIFIAALFVIALLGCQPAPDKQANAEKMFKDYCAMWSTHDLDKIVSFFADSCVYENLAREQTYRGKEGVKAYAKACFDAIPDFKVQVVSVFVSGDWLASEWVMTGTHSGALPDLPPTGKAFTVRGSSVVQLRDNKILRNTDYWDLMTFLRQLGVMK